MVLLVVIVTFGMVVYLVLKSRQKLDNRITGGYSGGSSDNDYLGGGRKKTKPAVDGEITAQDLFNNAYSDADGVRRRFNRDGKKLDGQRWWQDNMKKHYEQYDTILHEWKLDPVIAEHKKEALKIGDDLSNEAHHFAYQTLTQIGGVDKWNPRKLAQFAMNLAWFERYMKRGELSQFGKIAPLIEKLKPKVDLFDINSYIAPNIKLDIKLHDKSLLKDADYVKK